MSDAFSMCRWADWLVASTAETYDDGEQRWIALFLYRQLLQGRQFVESARVTGDALPQFTLRMPKEGDMDYLREVQAFADFVVGGQLGETSEQAQRRLEVRAFINGIGGAVNDATMDALNAYVRGEITSADLAARIKVWPLL